jgi:hypothetical protein
MCALLGLLLCVSLMLWTSSNAYARGTYHHAGFVPFSSMVTTRKPSQEAERRQCRPFAGTQSCARWFPHCEPDASLAPPKRVWR